MKSFCYSNVFVSVAFCIVMLICAFPNPLSADGMIFPIDPDIRRPSPIVIISPSKPAQDFTVPLSVTKHHVKINIDNLAARTHVDQKFYNHQNHVIEGLYMFPLPVGASITGFAMDIAGKMTTGELLDADKAKKIYEDIVRQMRDPALLEYVGRGLFKTRIYPIEPLSEKPVKLDYNETLKAEGNLVRYVYPLNIERFGKESMKDVSIEVKINSNIPVTSVYSPTHKVSVHRSGPGKLSVGFEANEIRPEEDFVLYYALSRKEVSLTAINHRPDKTEDGFFMLMLAPTIREQEKQQPAIDVALIMDTSGSMAGKSIEQAKESLNYCINSLSEQSNFFLCSFSTEAESYKPELTPANTLAREGALNYIKNLSARGGTNISEALDLSLKALNISNSGNPAYIVFVTDGKPTAGTTDIKKILKDVQLRNKKKLRIFSFGVGDSLNTHLIDSLAENNGGISDYVSLDEDLEIKISNLFSRLTHPAMTDVNLLFSKVQVSQVYPRKISDIFKDSNILILGRYKNPGASLITLTGTVEGKKIKYEFETDFPAWESEKSYVAKLWAARKIGYLLEQIRKIGSNEELKSELISLAKRYGILTPYTSFLVIEDTDQHGPNLRTAMRRPEAPASAFNSEKTQFSLKRLDTLSEGADAVSASREVNKLRMTSVPSEPYRQTTQSLRSPQIKSVSGKTFYFITDKWIDSEIKQHKDSVTIMAYSDAYFELLNRHQSISRWLSVGEKIMFKVNGRIIEISPDSGISDPARL